MQTGRERLHQWIERSKLNQVEAAEIIGMDYTQLNHILNGRRRPGLDTAVKIETATGIVVEAWVPFGDDTLAQRDRESVETANVDKA